ncbi:hypothetical protein F5Y15DRAFT_316182 [Xylariaceae sp. FL0016]|nr:hypothetical protein F5Y15DRAFT_316182 [Xylariaceae sp. FL0016]
MIHHPPIIIVIEKLFDGSLGTLKTSNDSRLAEAGSSAYTTGNLISLSFYNKWFELSSYTLRDCAGQWVQLTWAVLYGPAYVDAKQVTWHRLSSLACHDVQFMTLSVVQLMPLEPFTVLAQSTAHGKDSTGAGVASRIPPTRYLQKTSERPGQPYRVRKHTLRRCQSRRRRESIARCRYPFRSYAIRLRKCVARKTAMVALPPDNTSPARSHVPACKDSFCLRTRECAQNNAGVESHSCPLPCQDGELQLVKIARSEGTDPQSNVGFWLADIHQDVDDHRKSFVLLNPESELQAGLDAASPESRALFQESPRFHELRREAEEEARDSLDTYWTWDQNRQQWFHEEEDSESRVWFPKEFG